MIQLVTTSHYNPHSVCERRSYQLLPLCNKQHDAGRPVYLSVPPQLAQHPFGVGTGLLGMC